MPRDFSGFLEMPRNSMRCPAMPREKWCLPCGCGRCADESVNESEGDGDGDGDGEGEGDGDGEGETAIWRESVT